MVLSWLTLLHSYAAGRGRGLRGRGRGGRRGGRGDRGPPKTKEQLDREMDDYFLKGDSQVAKSKLDQDLDDYFAHKPAETTAGEAVDEAAAEEK